MTLTEGLTRVRHLINQTDNTDTLFDDTNFIGYALNQGRRMFATILPEGKIPKLRKRGTLTCSANVGPYPSDYLKSVSINNIQVVISGSTYDAKLLKPDEMWLLGQVRANSTYTNDLLTQIYCYERDDGVRAETSSTVTTIYWDYIVKPVDLDGTDRVDLPENYDDLVVDFAFKKCLGTKRGDKELANLIWRQTKEAA